MHSVGEMEGANVGEGVGSGVLFLGRIRWRRLVLDCAPLRGVAAARVRIVEMRRGRKDFIISIWLMC